MEEQNEVDFNDLMFGINDQREEREIISISNNSALGSSLSNFGIDRNNPQENYQYIQQNQDPQAIIQGIGVADRNSNGHLEERESGLGTSISKTRNSEFIPEIIEIQRQVCSETHSVSESTETQPGASGENYGYSDNDESENSAESQQETAVSTFDLALERGYHDQAKIAYDAATSEGVHVKTKFVKKLKDIGSSENVSELKEEIMWSEKYTLQRVFMLEKDFKEYLENLERNEWKKVLNKLYYKKDLNEVEKQIKKYIKTKDNRNKFKKDTIIIIKNYIEKLHFLKKALKEIKLK